MSAEFTRRSLATGLGSTILGLGGSEMLAQRAIADTPFTSFAFPATGTPTSRTMPDRLAETKNVRDFGAVGNGIADDTAAIQAAVNWTSGPNRGTIYFPLGAYRVTSPITFNYDGDLSICFRGENYGSFINGTFNGYIFDRKLVTPNNTGGTRIFEKLRITNSHATGGSIRIGSSIGVVIRDCILSAHICVNSEDAAGFSSRQLHIENCICTCQGNVAGSHHVIIGGGGTIMGCDFHHAETAVRAYGSGLHIAGNRAERNGTAFLLGLDSAGNNVGLSGFSLMAGTMEGNWNGIDIAGDCSGFVISDYQTQGHDATNAGPTSGVQATHRSLYIRANKARAGVIKGLTFSSHHEVAAVEIENATERTNLIMLSVAANVAGPGAGVKWILPTNAYTVQILQSNIYPIWTFAQLPTGANVLEGDEFDISDSTTATWGANVTVGGGANRVRVRYNGTNWTVMGV